MAAVREKIKLVSTGTINGKKTGTMYTLTKNKRLKTEKMRVKKFDKRLQKHVEFVEESISKGKKK